MQTVVQDPVPIVARAEAESPLEKTAHSIGQLYKRALTARHAANTAGMSIGMLVIDLARTEFIAKKLIAHNTREEKSAGGTATRAHNFVCAELAKSGSYNADYLQACARQYLYAYNAQQTQTRGAVATFDTKTGVLTCDAYEVLPVINPVQPKSPIIDETFADPNIQQSTGAVEVAHMDAFQLVSQHGDSYLRRIGLADGQLNPPAVKALAKYFSPIFAAHKLSIVTVKSNPKGDTI